MNDRPENLLLLAYRLSIAVEDTEKLGADVSFVLQRNRGLVGANTPWGLMLQIKNYGQRQKEVRGYWSETLERLRIAVEELPADLSYWLEL